MMQLSPELRLSMSPSLSSPGNGFYGDIDGWSEDVKQVADDIESSSCCLPKSETFIDMDWTGTGQKVAIVTSGQSRYSALHGSQYENIKRVCLVCGDIASGLHYGIASCEACKAFFKRTVQGRIEYVCPATGNCEMSRKRRKACQACRYKKCIDQGMNPDGIRPDRSKGGQGNRSGIHRPGSTTSPPALQRPDLQGQNKVLSQLLSIEPQKVFASPNDLMVDGEEKMMMTLANLVDRELVATIGWAKQVPGFTSLALADQMSLLQRTWLDILHLNFSYRSASKRNVFVFSDDFQVSTSDIESYGLSFEFTTVTRLLANKLSNMCVSREEYVLLKTLVLLNSDAGVANESAVDAVRHQMFDTLLHYEKSRGRGGAPGSAAVSCRRAGDLLLTLPLLTHQVALAKDFWRRVKSRGYVEAHRLLDEMVDHALAA